MVNFKENTRREAVGTNGSSVGSTKVSMLTTRTLCACWRGDPLGQLLGIASPLPVWPIYPLEDSKVIGGIVPRLSMDPNQSSKKIESAEAPFAKEKQG